MSLGVGGWDTGSDHGCGGQNTADLRVLRADLSAGQGTGRGGHYGGGGQRGDRQGGGVGRGHGDESQYRPPAPVSVRV